MTEEVKIPTAFISYSWDSDEHKDWVLNLAVKLRKDGVNVILDRWSIKPGDYFPEFMERSVRESDFILIICTSNYKEKSNNRKGGVGYEQSIMTAEAARGTNHSKFIPILLNETWEKSAASWVEGKYYINLQDKEFEKNYRELLLTIHNQRPQPPPIGKPPKLNELLTSNIESGLDIIENTLPLKSNLGDLPSGYTFLTFKEGDPGLPGNGHYIHSLGRESLTGTGITIHHDFTLESPFCLSEANKGVTLAFFLSPYVNAIHDFDNLEIKFGDLTEGKDCSLDMTGTGKWNSEIVSLNGVRGIAFDIPFAFFELNLQGVNEQKPHCKITLGNLYLKGVSLTAIKWGHSVSTLDAVVIAYGKNRLLMINSKNQ